MKPGPKPNSLPPSTIERYRKGESPQVLADELGIHRGTLLDALDRAGCEYRQPTGRNYSLPEEQEAEIVKRYVAGEGSTTIGKDYGITKARVWGVLRRHKITIRSKSEGHHAFKVNESAFSSTEEPSAYWAGFLMADGCISIPDGPKTWQPAVILQLAEKDKNHLEAYKAFIEAEHSIMRRSYFNAEGKEIVSYRLSVVSRPLVDSLIKFGVVPHKTNRTKACEALLFNRHFWRGVVDGDGHIGAKCAQENRVFFNVLASAPLANQFISFCSKMVPGSRGAVLKRKGCFRVSYNGEDAWKILKLLYENVHHALWRKQKHAMAIVEKHRNRT